MGYVLVGAIVAVVMIAGIVAARRVEGPGRAFGVTAGAIVISVAAWMVMAELLDLPDSASAATIIALEMMLLAAFSVRQHRISG